MLKKKTLTETIYNNGDPFQVREAIGATIGAWQKREDVDVLWETMEIKTQIVPYETASYARDHYRGKIAVYNVEVEAVYDDSMA